MKKTDSRPIILLGLALFFLQAIAADGPTIGQPAPDFELPDQDGQLHSLEDYRNHWVVLYFYPKVGTPACTTEAGQFRDNIFAFRKLNAQVIGISLDDIESHSTFAENYELPFPLLADTGGLVAASYGVRTRMFGKTVAKRQTFIINPAGTLVKYYRNVKPGEHAVEILAELETLTAAQ